MSSPAAEPARTPEPYDPTSPYVSVIVCPVFL